ncbi:MAG: hypothetical protein PUF91_02400 [Lactobacillus delbrueckii]|nr:hypothetical protein [Lactobacillus delbrueckii]
MVDINWIQSSLEPSACKRYPLSIYSVYTKEERGGTKMLSNTVKARQVGNSKVFTIPKDIVADAEEYSVYKGRDGVIVYIPESSNPFNDPDWDKKFTDCKQEEAFGGLNVDDDDEW